MVKDDLEAQLDLALELDDYRDEWMKKKEKHPLWCPPMSMEDQLEVLASCSPGPSWKKRPDCPGWWIAKEWGHPFRLVYLFENYSEKELSRYFAFFGPIPDVPDRLVDHLLDKGTIQDEP